jgi:hypothetical protein
MGLPALHDVLQPEEDDDGGGGGVLGLGVGTMLAPTPPPSPPPPPQEINNRLTKKIIKDLNLFFVDILFDLHCQRNHFILAEGSKSRMNYRSSYTRRNGKSTKKISENVIHFNASCARGAQAIGYRL